MEYRTSQKISLSDLPCADPIKLAIRHFFDRAHIALAEFEIFADKKRPSRKDIVGVIFHIDASLLLWQSCDVSVVQAQ